MISAHRALRAGLRAAAAALACAVLAGTARAETSWRIHDAGDVLASFTRSSSGPGLVFDDPSGVSWDLVTAIEDPAIRNRGDGRFHPADPVVVAEALTSLAAGAPDLGTVDVFLLPYPRRHLLDSSADGRGIYLSPGVHPHSREQLHALVVHELGHVLHHRRMPDRDADGWNTYRRLRGIEDGGVYHERAAHRNRPHEIFAEDFRALFGGALANYSGSIENRDLAHSSAVTGLRDFMAALSAAPAAVALRAAPNPVRGQDRVTFTLDAPAAVVALSRLDIVDARGRLVRRLSAPGAGGAIVWDGRDGEGRAVASGVYVARVAAGRRGSAVRLVVAR